MKIVVDTNIIFSGLLSPNGKISDLLLNSSDKFDFYSPTYLLDELENHKLKLLKISGFFENELEFMKRNIFKKIEFIDLEYISDSIWVKAIELTKKVDEYDAPFVALALELESAIWTGDKKLAMRLKNKGIDWVLTTDSIAQLRDDR